MAKSSEGQFGRPFRIWGPAGTLELEHQEQTSYRLRQFYSEKRRCQAFMQQKLGRTFLGMLGTFH